MAVSFRRLLATVAGTALAAGCVAAATLVARRDLAAAGAELAGEHVLPLLVAAICAPLVPATTAGAWRSVLASRNRRWLACGVSTSVGLAQSTVFGVVLGVGSVLGALPVWTIVPAFGLPAVTGLAGRLALWRAPGERVACLATAASLAPLACARLLGWVATGAVARVLLVVAVLEALATPHPVAAAIVAVCGLAIGNAFPFAPGGIGVGAATMSVALGDAGLHASTAVAAAVSFHAFETAAGLLFGAGGWLVLRLADHAASRAHALVEPELPLAASAS